MLEKLTRRRANRGGADAVASAPGSLHLFSPVRGVLVPLDEVADAAFASGALGRGVGISPDDGHVVAPVTGVIRTLMPHAIGLETDEGAQVLVHIGIDTVQLGGRGFTQHCAKGDHVTAGAALVDVDLEVVTGARLDPTVLVTLVNSKDFHGISVRDAGPLGLGAPILAALPNGR